MSKLTEFLRSRRVVISALLLEASTAHASECTRLADQFVPANFGAKRKAVVHDYLCNDNSAISYVERQIEKQKRFQEKILTEQAEVLQYLNDRTVMLARMTQSIASLRGYQAGCVRAKGEDYQKCLSKKVEFLAVLSSIQDAANQMHQREGALKSKYPQSAIDLEAFPIGLDGIAATIERLRLSVLNKVGG